MLGEYQSVVGETSVVSMAFHEACVKAISEHMVMMLALLKKRPDLAATCLQRTADIAGEMVVLADKLVTKSGELEGLAKTALIAAQKDSTKTADEKRREEQLRAEREARRAKYVAKQKEYAQQIEEAKAAESRARADAKEARLYGMITSVVQSVGQAAVAYNSPLLGLGTSNSVSGGFFSCLCPVSLVSAMRTLYTYSQHIICVRRKRIEHARRR